MQMKIVDAFPFYNELNMLKYRLTVLDDVVDYFVIVEATRTFVGELKPLFYKENAHLFEAFKHKIIHHVVDLPYPNVRDNPEKTWENDWHQRNMIQEPLETLGLVGTDVLHISDLDEIINPEILREVRTGARVIDNTYKLEFDNYYYNLNTRQTIDWYTPILTSKAAYHANRARLHRTICGLRNEFHAFPIIRKAGWHMSFFGDAQFIRNKLQQYAHQEHNTAENTDLNVINQRIALHREPFIRPREESHIALYRMEIKDNPRLPPMYDTLLRGFYDASP
jgi:beta-1,4-mannosyl-glycoprotein beta-1,4-N-acetylglucosaminyltransferase